MRRALLFALLLLLALPATAFAAARGRGRGAAAMAAIPAGSYRPLYGRAGGDRVSVAAFRLDRTPVTRGEYLDFVRANPAWRRDAVRPVFTEPGYLASWTGALDAGDTEALRRPVTEVSWFAARAYCGWRGKRLPTVDEWEYVAAASAERRDASTDPAFVRQLLARYAGRAGTAPGAVGQGAPNVYGVRDLHDLVWEWTADFNSVIVADDSRSTGSGVAERDHGLFCASAAIGAADPTNYAAFLRYAVRAGLTGRATMRTLGFRCAA
ncbi:MAG TPA: formylglycine-generating enzyme family protein [Gemmatimonadaceae bacterium]|nr:formylglycine-generating enzyme family protein [Gemmatimonadaceae bacterium]